MCYEVQLALKFVLSPSPSLMSRGHLRPSASLSLIKLLSLPPPFLSLCHSQ